MSKSAISRSLSLALSLSAVLLIPGITHGQEAFDVQNDMRLQLAKIGGQAQAVARMCGDYGDAELAQMKQQQRDIFTAQGSGFSAEAFDKAFAEGERETTAKISAMSKSERVEVCKTLQQQSGMGGM